MICNDSDGDIDLDSATGLNEDKDANMASDIPPPPDHDTGSRKVRGLCRERGELYPDYDKEEHGRPGATKRATVSTDSRSTF